MHRNVRDVHVALTDFVNEKCLPQDSKSPLLTLHSSHGNGFVILCLFSLFGSLHSLVMGMAWGS